MQTCCMYSAADPPINVRYRPVPPNNKKKRKNSFLEAAPFFKKKTKTKQPILLDDLIRKMLMWSMFSPQIPRKSSNSLNLVCVHRYSQCVSYFYRGLVALNEDFPDRHGLRSTPIKKHLFPYSQQRKAELLIKNLL